MVRTRMAPSPTGEYHIGSLRTMLYNYAWAKKQGGNFILRIEDTDRNRLVEGALERILKDIRDYGLLWDEGPEVGGQLGPYIQSERLGTYLPFAEQLVADSHAYYCFCTSDTLKEMKESQMARGEQPRYDRRCRNIDARVAHQRVIDGESYVIRLKMPDDEIVSYQDVVLGEISFNTNDVDDQVLMKSDGFPTYHLAVVVDDHLMEISHILRGMEWVSSMPKHIKLYQYLGWDMPETGHLPLLLDPNGGKMSKRFGATHARAFLDQGYLPEAMLNFLALLGWTHPDEKEVFGLDEFIEVFDIHDLHKSNAVFDRQKLDWMNGVYIRQLSGDDLSKKLITRNEELTKVDSAYVSNIVPLVQERMKTLGEFAELTHYFFEDPPVSLESVLQKGKTSEETKEVLQKAAEVLEGISEDQWNTGNLEKYLRELQESLLDWSPKQLFMSIRIAVTGETATPPLFDTLAVIGKRRVLSRLRSL